MESGEDLVATLRSGSQGLWIHEEQGTEEGAVGDLADVRKRNEGSMSLKQAIACGKAGFAALPGGRAC